MTKFAERTGRLTDRFGGRWIGVRFLDTPPGGAVADEMRFCEAVMRAATSRVVLTDESVTCPGAKRSFGWAAGMDEGLAESMATRQGLPLAVTRELVRSTPRLDGGMQAVEVGGTGRPDLVLCYATPLIVMKVVRAVELGTGKTLAQSLSGALSVCGNVAARCVKTGEVSISFGCRQSREAGYIGRESLAVAMPWAFVERLLGEPERTPREFDPSPAGRMPELDRIGSAR